MSVLFGLFWLCRCVTRHIHVFHAHVSVILVFFAIHISFTRACLGHFSLHFGGNTSVFRLHICDICQIDTYILEYRECVVKVAFFLILTATRVFFAEMRWKTRPYRCFNINDRYIFVLSNIRLSLNQNKQNLIWVDTILLVLFDINDRYIYVFTNTYLCYPIYVCYFFVKYMYMTVNPVMCGSK